jgi:hypothetical protein
VEHGSEGDTTNLPHQEQKEEQKKTAVGTYLGYGGTTLTELYQEVSYPSQF